VVKLWHVWGGVRYGLLVFGERGNFMGDEKDADILFLVFNLSVFTYLWCLFAEQANSDVAHSRMNQYSFWNIFVIPRH